VLHAARRAAGGGIDYDDRVVRARLAQAFGRLIRGAGDRGTFVLLSAATPSRLLTAFPAGVRIIRLPLAEAIERVRLRLSSATVPADEDTDAASPR
jgi:ATP-dependent DNA helicase DinG